VGVTAPLAAIAAALVLAASPAQDAARYLESRQVAGGCFAEPGGGGQPGLSAWAILGLRAAGRPARGLEGARACLARNEPELTSVTDVALAATAIGALGERPDGLLGLLRAATRPDGRVGPTVNSTVWAILAFRQAGEAAPPRSVRYVLARQARSGGWGWAPRAAPDSNDTAAAIQALRAAGVGGRPIARGLAYLRRLQSPDGGFELTPGRGSDTQSTAWAIQAFVAAGARPGAKAHAYLLRMRRPDGSFRYSARYVATPAWVTAQALPALVRKPFPLR
jgi:Prenyltransferase and squalene oxidase repeat